MFIEHLLLSITQGPVPETTQDKRKKKQDGILRILVLINSPLLHKQGTCYSKPKAPILLFREKPIIDEKKKKGNA